MTLNALALMYVAFGGAAGSMSRYIVYCLLGRASMTGTFPISTFAVNILGSFALGLWIASVAFMMPSRGKDLHLLVAIGFLGGFTTFSAFAMDSYLLLERGLLAQAVLYIGGSVLLSVVALFGGMWVIKSFAG